MSSTSSKRATATGWLWLAAAVAVAALAIGVRVGYWLDYAPKSDERDYRIAAQESFGSIYFGSNTAPLPTILRRYWSDPSFYAHPWATLEAEHDQLALRHFHTPLSFYPSSLFGDRLLTNRAHRAFPIFVSAACAPLVLLGGWWLGVSFIPSVLGALLVAVDGRFVVASMIMTPHPLYVWLSIAFLIALVRLLDHPAPGARRLMLTILGAAIACLELAPLLVAGAIGAAAIARLRVRDLVGEWPEVGWNALWLMLVLLIAWPAGILGLGYGTAYGVFVALALFHRGEYYGEADAATLYHRLFSDNAWLALAAAGAVIGALLLAWRGPRRPALAVTVAYAALALAFNWLNRFRNATYASEATIFLWVMLAVVMDELWKRGRSERVVAAVVTVMAGVGILFELRAIL